MSLKFSDLAPSLDDAAPHYQQWLAKVDDLLPAVTLAPSGVSVDPDGDFTVASCRGKFPSWPWIIDICTFTWCPKIPRKLTIPPKWDGSAKEWASG